MKVIFGTDAIKFPLTGIGRYAFELANHLAGVPKYPSCFIYVEKRSVLIFLLQKRHILLLRVLSIFEKNRLASEFYRITAPWFKTNVLRKHKDAIYHGPNFYLPLKLGDA